MSYRREFEKALKQYLKSLGYKYEAKNYRFVKQINDDIVHSIGLMDETRFRPHYFWLRVSVDVYSKKMESFLSSLICDESCCFLEHVSFETIPRRDDPHVEIMGERSMEENMALFSAHMEKYAFPLLNQFTDLESIVNYLLHDKMNNADARDWVSYRDNYTYPLAYYLAGQTDRCLKQLEKNREHLEWQASHPDSMAVYVLERYRPFQANLTQWIKEGKVVTF